MLRQLCGWSGEVGNDKGGYREVGRLSRKTHLEHSRARSGGADNVMIQLLLMADIVRPSASDLESAMPEGDRFERSFRAGWRSAYNYVKDGGASTEEVGDKLAKTLVKKLRDTGGLPQLPDMTQIISDSNPEAVLRQFDALDRLVRLQNGQIHTKIAAEVAKSITVQSTSRGFGLDGDIARQFAQGICQAVVENGFFAKAGSRLVEEGRFSNLQQFREWQGGVERTMGPSIAKIADQLMEKPDAKALRAPNRMSKKKTTSEILVENLL